MRLRHLERLPLDAGWPDLATKVRELLDALEGKEQCDAPEVIVDITGVGKPVLELLKGRGIEPLVVTVAAGSETVETAWNEWRVAKTELIGTLQLQFQTGKIKTASEIPLVGTFIKELQDFSMRPPKISPGDGEAWREGAFDDLVLAVALAVWRGHKHTPTPKDVRRMQDERIRAHYANQSWLA